MIGSRTRGSRRSGQRSSEGAFSFPSDTFARPDAQLFASAADIRSPRTWRQFAILLPFLFRNEKGPNGVIRDEHVVF